MIDQTKISRDLAEIVDLTGDLQFQAINDANAQVDGHSLPGGRAMIALAPVASLSVWERQAEEIEAAWAAAVADGRADHRDRPDVASEEDDSAEPALQLLRFWSDHYRRITQQDWLHQPTLITEANYLRSNLEWILAREPHVDIFARDINRARVVMENILTAGRRAERSRVVCDVCEKETQLIKVHAQRVKVGYTCECGSERTVAEDGSPGYCPNPCTSSRAPEPVWHSDDADDRWKCPACKKRFDQDAFLRAHARQLRLEGAARFVPQSEAVDTLVAQGRSKRTVRAWLDCPIRHDHDRCTVCRRKWDAQEYPVCPGLTQSGRECGGELEQIWKGDRDDVVEGYCDIKTRRVYVWWPDLWRRHLSRATRRRSAAS